jgi:hypothetical protein
MEFFVNEVYTYPSSIDMYYQRYKKYLIYDDLCNIVFKSKINVHMFLKNLMYFNNDLYYVYNFNMLKYRRHTEEAYFFFANTCFFNEYYKDNFPARLHNLFKVTN